MTDVPRSKYSELSSYELHRLAKPENAPSDPDDRVALADELRRRALGMATGSPMSVARGTGSTMLNRYRDAYLVGSVLSGVGSAIKIAGAVFAGIVVIVSASAGGSFVLVGIVIGAISGGLFWVCGVIVAAQGQILRATLDTAVAHSPFLTDSERLDAMGLPHSVGEHTSSGA